MAESLTSLLGKSTQVSTILTNLNKYKFNPAGIQRVVLAHLRDITDGKIDIVDPSNPFVFLLEASAVNTASFLIENEANTRKLYPAVGQTPEDLYLHMSDKDYIGRFASPAKTTFSLLIQKEELLGKMVTDFATGIRKITIPRNTEFKVADTTFCLQYPVDIKEMLHGGLQIVYDVSVLSPLQTLQTNLVKNETRIPAGTTDEWLYIELEAYQYKVESYNAALTSANTFNQDYLLTDQYSHARIYYKSNTTNSQWVEIKTTHSDQVYDPNDRTAVLQLLERRLNVTIPQIYLSTGQMSGSLRVDIYETKGAINLLMENYTPSAFEANWRSIDKSEDTPYSAVITTLSNLIVYSKDVAVGGRDALSFETLRSRVIRNAVGTQELPITNVQIETSLEDQGYEVVKNIDLVTNRVFLATRSLPAPFDERLITAGATSVETFITSIAELVNHSSVMNNGSRITITPDIVYKNNNGIIQILPRAELMALLLHSPDSLATNVTRNNYLYTPFHYVLDIAEDEFEVRPYYLDKPVAETVTFVSQNDTTMLQVNTDQYSVERTSAGYRVTVVTASNDAYKAIDPAQIQAQLSFIPVNEDKRAYVNGIVRASTDTGERIIDFDINCNFDVDSSDNIHFTSFLMFNTEPKIFKSALLNDFDITYSTSIPMGSEWSVGVVDSKLGKFILPLQAVGITNEQIRLKFGSALKTLWARSRSAVDAAAFLRYTVDVPWVYEKDTYKTDPSTGSIFTITPGGEPEYQYLGRAGEVVTDDFGIPVIRYRAGDIVLDNAGRPIPTSADRVSRQIDMMFIEGAYFFATDAASSTYRDSIVTTVVGWLTGELTDLTALLLEQTRLYFYPKTTMGVIQVVADGGITTNVEAGQSFGVKLYVNQTVFDNPELKDILKSTTVRTIDNVLKQTTVSNSLLIAKLTEAFGEDVISFSVSGLGAGKNINTLTIVNDGERLSIKKRLTALPDNKLIVEEDVTCDFFMHSR